MCCHSLWRGGGREPPSGDKRGKANVQEGLFPAHTATTTTLIHRKSFSQYKEVHRDSHYLPLHQSDCCHKIKSTNQIALIMSRIYQLSHMTHLLWRQVEVMRQLCVCIAVRREG